MTESRPGRGVRRLVPALLAVVITAVPVLGANSAIQMSCTPHGVLDLQFSTSAGCARQVLRSWAEGCAPPDNEGLLCIDRVEAASAAQLKAEGRAAEDRLRIVRWALYLDVPFFIAYSFFLWRLCRQAAAAFTGPGRAAGRVAASAAPLAGLADASENLAHLRFLDVGADRLGPALFDWGYYSAMTKWGLLGLIAAFLAAAALRALFRGRGASV